MRVISAILISYFFPLCIFAQITPAENSALNYRIIGFSFPEQKGIVKYRIEIAAGNYTNDEFFQKNIIDTFSSSGNRLVTEVPAFGSPYTWRVLSIDKHAMVQKSELHHFKTLEAAEINPDSSRLRIVVPGEKMKDMYVFIDASKTLYDFEGHPIWFIPNVGGIPTKYLIPRDLKYSGSSTITFMMNEQDFEINYNGDVLWREPDTSLRKKTINDKIKSLYHHEFTRLSNGHYMTLGMERVQWQLDSTVDTSRVHFKQKLTIDRNGNLQQKIFSGRIVEFDQNHKEIWSWRAAEYLRKSDLFYRRKPNGLFNVGNVHENAFYFDERAKVLYASFRNIHRIVKISYPSGRTISTYGELYIPGNQEVKNDLFCGQHNIRKSQEGYLYLFNNNTCNRLCGQMPTIIMMQEPATPKGQLKRVWEYECTLDSLSAEEQSKLKFETGGSVLELKDKSILCCMAGNYSRVFIVNRDKKILWDALPEKWDIRTQKWKVLPGYRASIITRKELESLIWGSH